MADSIFFKSSCPFNHIAIAAMTRVIEAMNRVILRNECVHFIAIATMSRVTVRDERVHSIISLMLKELNL
ncbi:hypothetical protein [Neoaquamicrobium sediminum]|uniref:hypothetical protein n=1 Tax=Neoaquamicrobium sediminum TaxID=1849104 RepID=UPI004035D34F